LEKKQIIEIMEMLDKILNTYDRIYIINLNTYYQTTIEEILDYLLEYFTENENIKKSVVFDTDEIITKINLFLDGFYESDLAEIEYLFNELTTNINKQKVKK
jgi:hypothetical protein